MLVPVDRSRTTSTVRSRVSQSCRQKHFSCTSTTYYRVLLLVVLVGATRTGSSIQNSPLVVLVSHGPGLENYLASVARSRAGPEKLFSERCSLNYKEIAECESRMKENCF